MPGGAPGPAAPSELAAEAYICGGRRRTPSGHAFFLWLLENFPFFSRGLFFLTILFHLSLALSIITHYPLALSFSSHPCFFLLFCIFLYLLLLQFSFSLLPFLLFPHIFPLLLHLHLHHLLLLQLLLLFLPSLLFFLLLHHQHHQPFLLPQPPPPPPLCLLTPLCPLPPFCPLPPPPFQVEGSTSVRPHPTPSHKGRLALKESPRRRDEGDPEAL